MLTTEFKKQFAIWFRNNSQQSKNIKDFIIERICKYSRDKRPSDQIVGMVTILDDLLRLEDEYLK